MEISDPLSVSAHPTDGTVLAALPRRHPDVDLVLLPAERAFEAPRRLSAEVAAGRLTEIDETLGSAWMAATGEGVRSVARWHYASEPGSVQAAARIALSRPDGLQLLASLRHHLEERGWTIARPPGAIERMVARLAAFELNASYAERSAALLVDLAAAPVRVGPEQARELVRRSGEL